MMDQQPVVILKEGTQRERGRGAQASNIMAGRAVADALRTALGPRGMDKMLVDAKGDVVITNDGATILQHFEAEHPVARMVIEVSKAQDQEVGDGTTTVVVLAGELLKNAEELIEDVHPTLVVKGYRMAAEMAIEILELAALRLDVADDDALRTVPITAMFSKAAGPEREHLATLAVRAVRAITEEREGERSVDVDNIQVVKRTGGSVTDTDLVAGAFLDQGRVHTGMPARLQGARIALLNMPFQVEKPEVDATIRIEDPAKLQEFLAEEENIVRGMVRRLGDSGATAAFCEKSISDLAQGFLAKAGIFAVANVKHDDMTKLARATGGRVVSELDGLEPDDLGTAGLLEERKVGEETMTFVSECPHPASVGILIRGGSQHVVDEIERNLHDALCVLKAVVEDEGRVLAGGGAPEAEAALRLRAWAPTVGGREQLAVEAFADALEVVPKTLAENAGLDAINMLVDLREAHGRGRTNHGVDVFTGKVRDMAEAGVLDPLRVKAHGIKGAAEVATMILRIDDTIASSKHQVPEAPGMP